MKHCITLAVRDHLLGIHPWEHVTPGAASCRMDKEAAVGTATRRISGEGSAAILSFAKPCVLPGDGLWRWAASCTSVWLKKPLQADPHRRFHPAAASGGMAPADGHVQPIRTYAQNRLLFHACAACG